MSWFLAPLLALLALLGAPLFTIIACITLIAFATNGIDTTSVAIEM